MPLFTQPAGGRRLREFNHCHNPEGDGGGRFCSDPDMTTPMAHDTMVGVTSYRSADKPGPGDRSNASTFARMHELTAALRAEGLEVDARPAQGAWDGAWEPSWAVGIKAGDNWDADAVARTMAQYGKRFNQDAVLLMHQCVDDCNSEYAELAFDGAVGLSAREPINKMLAAAGMGGWTWFKGANGRTTLRVAHVPQWAERDLAAHNAAMKRVYTDLGALGYTMGVARTRVRAEVLERDKRDTPAPNVRSYDQVLAGGRRVNRKALPKDPGRNQPAAGWPSTVY